MEQGVIALPFSFLKSFDYFAWTLITLVYPLYVSIRAIEGNSKANLRKFLIFWVVYALIMLFEVTFGKLIECWLSLWPLIKLFVAWKLVVPRFDGAIYVYEHAVRPCISVNPHTQFNHWFKSQREEFLLNHGKDDFLLLAQRYIKENGSEDLEKLIVEKVKQTKPFLIDQSETVQEATEKRVTLEKATAVAIETVQAATEKRVALEKAAAVAFENVQAATEKRASLEKKAAVAIETVQAAMVTLEKKAAVAIETLQASTEKRVALEKKAAIAFETVQAATEKSVTLEKAAAVAFETVQATTDKRVTLEKAAAVGGELDAKSKGTQKEWTCALCLISTTNEAGLTDHLKGKKHKAKEAELRETKTATMNRNKNNAFNPDDHIKPNQPKIVEPKKQAVTSNIVVIQNPNKDVKKQPVVEMSTSSAGGQGAMKNHIKNPESTSMMTDRYKTKSNTVETVDKEASAAIGAVPEALFPTNPTDTGTSKNIDKVKQMKLFLTDQSETVQAATEKRVTLEKATTVAIETVQAATEKRVALEKAAAIAFETVQAATEKRVALEEAAAFAIETAQAATEKRVALEKKAAVAIETVQAATEKRVALEKKAAVAFETAQAAAEKSITLEKETALAFETVQAATEKSITLEKEAALAFETVQATTDKRVTLEKAAAVRGELDTKNKGTQKEWTCALCLISTTNEASLTDHLKGKKHKAKEAELRETKTATMSRNKNNVLNPDDHNKPNQPNIVEPKKQAVTCNIIEIPNPNKHVKKQAVVQISSRSPGGQGAMKNQTKKPEVHENEKLWCSTCKIQCSSTAMLNAHRYGKKHKSAVARVGLL